MNDDDIIAIETYSGDIIAPQDGIEEINSWNESGVNEKN